MVAIYMEYKRSPDYGKKSFRDYLKQVGFTDPSVEMIGMDDKVRYEAEPGGPLRLAVPGRPVSGEMKVKVLLVEFPDRPKTQPPEHYQDLLFSNGTYPTGSRRYFYKEASHGKVEVTGTCTAGI